MGRTASNRLATVVWVAGLGLALAAIPLLVIDRTVPTQVFGSRGTVTLFAFTFGSVGWLISTRRPSNPIGWLLLTAGFLSGLQIFGGEYGTFSLARHGGSLPLTNALGWVQSWLWVVSITIGVVVMGLLYPTGTLLSRRWRPALVLAIVAGATFAAAMASTTGQVTSMPLGFTNPYGHVPFSAPPVQGATGLLFFIALGCAVVALVRRFRHSSGDQHEQMKWIAYASAFVVVTLVPDIVINSVQGGIAQGFVGKLFAVLTLTSVGLIPVAAGIAILTKRLYDIDVVINKTLVFGAVAAFITVVYVAVVAGIGAAVGSRSNVWLSILATAIVAVAFTPVRNRANRFANRVVFGQRATPYETLSLFGDRMAAATADAFPELARLMTEATAASTASVWLAIGPEFVAAATWPPDAAPRDAVPLPSGDVTIDGYDRVYPVRHEGELLGALAIATTSAEPLSPAQDKLLADLASQAALVMRNGRLIAELQASRQRIVAAADAARRRIERNLHDGAQQHLVALSVKIGLVRQLLGSDPAAATAMLEELKGDAGEALDELRTLARGIYPPLLADQGLASALVAQARKTAIPVDVESDGIARYPQDVEAAVYFCVLEALQNVAKYSHASRARIRLWSEDGRVAFSVTDDGQGFDPTSTPRGSGLTNMGDRIEALGGMIEVSSQPGAGTTVTGWVRATPESSTGGDASATLKAATP